jgi:hypothetical protein
MAPIAELTLGAGNSPRWIPLEADLSAWVGQRVTLRLELLLPEVRALTKSVQIGYLGSPRIVRRDEPDALRVRSDG